MIYSSAVRRLPEFSGHSGRRYPGQQPPRPLGVEPRRMRLPPTFSQVANTHRYLADCHTLAATSCLLPGRGVAQHRQQADIIPVSRHAKVWAAQEDCGQATPPARLISVGILHRLCVHKHISHLNEKFFLNYQKETSWTFWIQLDILGYYWKPLI